jgi:hypothetical protein
MVAVMSDDLWARDEDKIWHLCDSESFDNDPALVVLVKDPALVAKGRCGLHFATRMWRQWEERTRDTQPCYPTVGIHRFADSCAECREALK